MTFSKPILETFCSGRKTVSLLILRVPYIYFNIQRIRFFIIFSFYYHSGTNYTKWRENIWWYTMKTCDGIRENMWWYTKLTNTGRYIYKAHNFQNISMMSNAVRLINLTTCINLICLFADSKKDEFPRTLFHVTYSNISCKKVKQKQHPSVVSVCIRIYWNYQKIKLIYRRVYGLIEMLKNIV